MDEKETICQIRLFTSGLCEVEFSVEIGCREVAVTKCPAPYDDDDDTRNVQREERKWYIAAGKPSISSRTEQKDVKTKDEIGRDHTGKQTGDGDMEGFNGRVCERAGHDGRPDETRSGIRIPSHGICID